MADVDISQIPKKIGYLKELGLDYGWGPSSMMETLFETLHIHGGLPWYGAAIAAAIIIRTLLLKPMFDASHMTAKAKAIKPLLDPYKQRMTKCARENDTAGAMKAKQQIQVINQQYGVKMWKTAIPMLQIPFGFACFRVLRGMAELPVPGLENESFWWLNSTMSDPYLILPMITSIALYFSIKV